MKFKKKEQLKKYEWSMKFKNGEELKGSAKLESKYIENNVINIFFSKKIAWFNQTKKGLYYNVDEILYFEICEVEECEK